MVTHPTDKPARLRQYLKYFVYLLLLVNVLLFFRQELAASSELELMADSWSATAFLFSATLDTLAWVLLLALFELETAVISDANLRNGRALLFSGARTLCYVVILWSFYGYLSMWQTLTTVEDLVPADPCDLVAANYRVAVGMDDYRPLTDADCAALTGKKLLQVTGTRIMGEPRQIAQLGRLALVDVINAFTWLLVVLLLELDVFLQVRGKLRRKQIQWTEYLSFPLYAVLLACAVYWGLFSHFLDFWDASLWLSAFAFIEMNIFNWQSHGKSSDNHIGVL